MACIVLLVCVCELNEKDLEPTSRHSLLRLRQL